jgi:hypothetical protein
MGTTLVPAFVVVPSSNLRDKKPQFQKRIVLVFKQLIKQPLRASRTN